MSTLLSKLRGWAPLFVVVALIFVAAMISWEFFQTEGMEDVVEEDPPGSETTRK